MIAVLLLLAAFSRVDLIDEHFEIPASDWRYVPRALTHDPAIVDCVFQADRPDAQVRLVMLSEADLNAWRMGRDHEEAATTPVGPRGLLRVSVHDPDTYIAIENRGTRAAGVRLRIFLEQANVRYLSRSRQLAVILISFGVFFGIVTFSARRLLKAIRR
ncbi:MAG TPA: hypothetical protein VMI94_00905 [Bryobacteraceae bacterium]|nr:hypothetical protein [Bryobacteraceae bacterium]